jgi:hypothetical protein
MFFDGQRLLFILQYSQQPRHSLYLIIETGIHVCLNQHIAWEQRTDTFINIALTALHQLAFWNQYFPVLIREKRIQKQAHTFFLSCFNKQGIPLHIHFPRSVIFFGASKMGQLIAFYGMVWDLAFPALHL